MAIETSTTPQLGAERRAAPARISVALVTRNRPESLERTLRSLQAQTVAAHEVVVSDDSDDSSAAATAELANRYGCRYVRGPRRGLYANRNWAADVCVGSHIRTMDDDHEFPPTHFEECARALLRDPHSIWILGEFLPNASREGPPPCPGELTSRGYARTPADPDRSWAISCGASIYPRELFAQGIRNAEFFKFGALYLEFGSRLHWLGFRIRFLPTTYIVHHLDMADRSYMDREIDLSSQFFAMFCHSWVYQPTLQNRTRSLLEGAKLLVKHRSTAWRAWRNAGRAFASHRGTLFDQRARAQKVIAAFESSAAAEARMIRWHIVTGEYPPQPGGVADYTRLLARELVRTGDEVQVWCSECASPTPLDPGVAVTRLPGCFGRRALRMLGAALDRSPRPFRLLVQYVPHMYGMRGMNVPFALWLRSRRADAPWIMFHEVAYPILRGQSWKHHFLARVQRLMARIVAGSAARIWVSIPGWEPILRELAPRIGNVTWLPVPSNVATRAAPGEPAAIRARLAIKPGEALVGHFGTFGGPVAGALAAILPTVLRKEDRAALLVGRGALDFKARLGAAHPDLARRLHAAADLDANGVADHLAACDILVQPYPDGVSGRRGSMMTGLALGIPTVTSDGHLTEPFWRTERLALLAPATDDAGLAALADRLLEDPDERRALGERAAQAYAARFGIEHSVRRLRSEAL